MKRIKGEPEICRDSVPGNMGIPGKDYAQHVSLIAPGNMTSIHEGSIKAKKNGGKCRHTEGWDKRHSGHLSLIALMRDMTNFWMLLISKESPFLCKMQIP